MFYYLNGTVAETGANLAVIDCGGVGYACATTNHTLSLLKKGLLVYAKIKNGDLLINLKMKLFLVFMIMLIHLLMVFHGLV